MLISIQSRMEADLIERNELLDRLSKRMSETERQVKGAQKRFVDQAGYNGKRDYTDRRII